MEYHDDFVPRPFQRDVTAAVLDGMASGRRATIALASPGSGKTLAYQAAACYAYREGLADLLAVFVPRIALAEQCELGWMTRQPGGTVTGNFRLFDSRARLGHIRHVTGQAPLPGSEAPGTGIVATYASLVTSRAYEHWARRNRGRFLLVADEAQFCGDSSDHAEGTRAGTLITRLHELAAHTLLLTGTPYRADGQPLVLAGYGDPGPDGLRSLACHAEAGYRDGVREGYLRPFTATLHDARVRWKAADSTVTEHDLSADGTGLAGVLRKPEVWQPIADQVVAEVRDKQRSSPEYRGLISCMRQEDARRVHRYLAARYPGLRVMQALSDDGGQSERALKQFKMPRAAGGGDIMCTVRKAFIGYDCPAITVIGILTHYRDPGHLEQLAGRGLRMQGGLPARSQSCRVIAPDDPRMTRFISVMQGESEQGLRERQHTKREAEGAGNGPGAARTVGSVESAEATTTRTVSIDPGRGPAAARGLPAEIPQTEQQQVQDINTRTAAVVKEILEARGIRSRTPGYGSHVKRVTGEVNRKARRRAAACVTAAQAQARLDAANRLLANQRMMNSLAPRGGPADPLAGR